MLRLQEWYLAACAYSLFPPMLLVGASTTSTGTTTKGRSISTTSTLDPSAFGRPTAFLSSPATSSARPRPPPTWRSARPRGPPSSTWPGRSASPSSRQPFPLSFEGSPLPFFSREVGDSVRRRKESSGNWEWCDKFDGNGSFEPFGWERLLARVLSHTALLGATLSEIEYDDIT